MSAVTAELLLTLSNLTRTKGEIPRASANATLTYLPAASDAPPVTSDPYRFTDPLGILPLDDLRWYLDSYAIWPGAAFRPRAERVEAHIQSWGRALYQAAIGNHPETKAALTPWDNLENLEYPP